MRYFTDTNGKTKAISPIQESLINDDWTEITCPIKDDGTLYVNHDNLDLVATDDDGAYYDYYLTDLDDDTGLYEQDTDNATENQATYKATYTQALADLESSDVQIQYHERSSSRAIKTKYDWFAYQEALRDIASKITDDDGNVTYGVNDISANTYSYTVDDVATDYTCSLDDDGYPMKPTDAEESE